MAYISEFTCIYSALVLQDDEVIVTERINALIKKNLRILMMLWALVFLIKPLL
uniref:Uncharacterized protein n=1 Tax=Urocitellus parryii TaxID=9999 RepID=A0A8D2HB91_UROPR